MAPETHLLASWVIAAFITDNPRDCRLVTLAGVLPDVDGLGLLVDAATGAWGNHPTQLYAQYHHYLLHGIWGAVLVSGVLAAFGQRRLRVGLLALLVFHIHILCDLAGSRGPSPEDLWPIFYLGPLTHSPMWLWHGQWRLDAWQNRYLSAGLFIWSLFLAVRLGHSFVGVFNRRLDSVFVGVLQRWRSALKQRFTPV